ncbi:MAG: hypothetical protein OEU92_28075, partial [Alphaproteobacteria bacterium]|nr:hypothetical protein [Alphaproteobacteria bacterium]
CMIYLLATALSVFAWRRQGILSAVVRVAAGMACVAEDPLVHGAGLVAGALIIATSQRSSEGMPETT